MSMRMAMGHGGGGGPSGGWGLMRSFRRDESVMQSKLPPGIVKRVLQFARPYRGMLTVFLGLIIVDAVIGAVNPLIYRAIIDNGIAKHNSSLVIALAVLIGVLAVFDAGLSLWQRWVSARVGEGLIYDMRAKVFAHIQQHAHRLLHPHPDRRAGDTAQQRRPRGPAGVHRHLLVGGQQRHRRGHHPDVHVLPVMADHARRPVPGAAVHHPGPLGGQAPGRHHPRVLRARTPR